MMKKFCLTFCMVMIAVLAFAGGIKVNKGKAQFIEGFNKKSKKIMIVQDESSADYIMFIKFTNFDKFYSMMSIVPGNKHRISGEIIVKDKKWRSDLYI